MTEDKSASDRTTETPRVAEARAAPSSDGSEAVGTAGAPASDATVSLSAWLVWTQRSESAAYEVVDFLEHTVPSDAVVAYLAGKVVSAKFDPTYLLRLAALLGWDAVSNRFVNGRATLKKGEFGEVLAAAQLEECDGWVIPIQKLRYQMDPGQTLPGTDLLAIRLDRDTGAVTQLAFLESKLRLKKDPVGPGAVVEAHNQLAFDRKAAFAGILEFVLARLYEQNSPILEPLERYLLSRAPHPNEIHFVSVVFDDGAWSEELISGLDTLPELLEPLTVYATRTPKLWDLIERVLSVAGLEPVDD